MPFVIVCAHCSAKLKTGQPVPAGRSVTCPQCKSLFTTTEAATEIPSDAPVTTASPKPVPPPPPPKPARSVSSALDGLTSRSAKNDDIPSAEILDDDRPRAKSKRSRMDDDDDRPKTRRDRNTDDEEDRPSSRRSRRPKDEDDDAPRSRRSRNTEHEDDRPRPNKASVRDGDDDEENDDIIPRSGYRGGRGRRGKKKPLLLLGLLGGGGLLMLLVVGVLMYTLDPFGLFVGGPSSEMLAWAPADSQTVAHVQVDEIVGNAPIGNGVDVNEITRAGLRQDEVASMMGAGKGGPGMMGGGMGGTDVTVFKLKSAADEARVISALGGKPASANGKNYFKTNGNGGLYFPSSRVVVLTRSETTLLTLLQKPEGKVVISDDLKKAVNRFDGTYVAGSIGSAASIDILGFFSAVGGMGGPVNPFPGGRQNGKPISQSMSSTVSGDRGTLKIATTYDNSAYAITIAEGLRTSLALRSNQANDFTYSVSQSGSTVTLTLKGLTRNNSLSFPGR